MSKRTKNKQSQHDKTVRKSVGGYKGQGWKIVGADIPGHPKPKIIARKRPDIIVKKGKKEIIVEVETKESHNKDKPQRKAFRKYANQSKNRKFKTKVVK